MEPTPGNFCKKSIIMRTSSLSYQPRLMYSPFQLFSYHFYNQISILEIYKNEQWESIVPQTIETIDYCKDDQSFGDYPYFRIQFNFYQKQMFQVKFLIIFN